MEFEWDAEKAASNLSKHGVSFPEAMTAFGDPLEVTILDPAHSEGESRSVSIARSEAGRVLVVAYTERGPADSNHQRQGSYSEGAETV